MPSIAGASQGCKRGESAVFGFVRHTSANNLDQYLSAPRR